MFFTIRYYPGWSKTLGCKACEGVMSEAYCYVRRSEERRVFFTIRYYPGWSKTLGCKACEGVMSEAYCHVRRSEERRA